MSVYGTMFTDFIVLLTKLNAQAHVQKKIKSTKYYVINGVPRILEETDPYVCRIWPYITKNIHELPFSAIEYLNIGQTVE